MSVAFAFCTSVWVRGRVVLAMYGFSLNWYTSIGIYLSVYQFVYQLSLASGGYPRTTTDTKKPANLGGMRALRTSPDLSGNNRFNIWWSWGDLNPRPKLLRRRHYMLSPVITFVG